MTMKNLRRWLIPGKYKNGYMPVADLFRVLCVLLVGWFHIWQQSWLPPTWKYGPVEIDLLPLVRTGYLMVDMMLLLSGFLLFIPYARAREKGTQLPDVPLFFKKRAARIIPSYYFCVFLMLFVSALPQRMYDSWRYMALDLIGHLTFTHNLTYEGYIGTRLNGVLWTLAVEGQFYILAPLIGRAFVKKPIMTYAGLTAVAFVYRFVYVNGMTNTSLYFNRLPAMLDVYANGMMCAWLCVALKRRLKPTPLTALGATVGCVIAVWGVWRIACAQATRFDGELIRMGQMIYRFPLSVCGAVILLCGTQMPRWLQAVMGNRVTRFLSGVSYNFYIWHSLVALRLRAWHIPPYVSEMPQKEGETPWQLHYTLLCFIAALAFATAMTYLIEKPGAKLLRKLLKIETSKSRSTEVKEKPKENEKIDLIEN